MQIQSRKYLVLAALLVLASCGGGDNGGDGATPPSATDVTPDTFTLDDVKDAEPGRFYTASMTVSGVDTVVKARVDGNAAFSVDGGKTFGTATADVENGDEIIVRLKSDAEASGIENGTLYVGGTSGSLDANGTATDTFEVATKADMQSPDVKVQFPPPMSMTDAPSGSKLLIRGLATDDFAVASVHVNDTEAKLDKVTGAWSFDYPIVTDVQTITVKATDSQGNVSEQVLSLTHVPSTDSGDFGAGVTLHNGAQGIIALEPQRLLYSISQEVHELDLSTGERRKVFDASDAGFTGIVTDMVPSEESSLVYVASYGAQAGLLRFDLEAGTATPLSLEGDGNGDDSGFNSVQSVAYDAENNAPYLLVYNTVEDASYLWRVDSETGAREVVSPGPYTSTNPVIRFDAATGRMLIADAGLYIATPGDSNHEPLMAGDAAEFVQLAADSTGREAIVFASGPGGLYELRVLDRTDNTIVVLPDGSDAAFGPELVYSHGFDVDWQNRVAYTASAFGETHPHGKRITAIDLEKGYRVIVAMEH